MSDPRHCSVVLRSGIESNVLKHLDNWLLYYIYQIEKQEELTPRSIAAPKSWRVVDAFTRNPEDAYPLVDVVSTGLAPGRRPQRDGDGSVKAWWSIAVGAVVSASDTQAAKDLAGYYAGAIRLVMEQMPDLGDYANGCDWEDESYDDWDVHGTERTVAAARLLFTVEIQAVMNVYLGPADSTDPPDDPYTTEPDPGLAHPVTVEFAEDTDG